MVKIATLGPTGTFSEMAAQVFLNAISMEGNICLYSTIGKVFEAVSSECQFGVLPIENSLDGFVQPTLDLLLKNQFHIHLDARLPIQFSFVADAKTLDEVNKAFIQFKTQGQCQTFVDTLSAAKIITTESNGEAYAQLLLKEKGTSAIIPQHMLPMVSDQFDLVIDPVTDSKENETRFILFSSKQEDFKSTYETYRTSLCIVNTKDRPGELLRIITEFAIGRINLKYIMSRPTKESLGKYIFFIDVDGNAYRDETLIQALQHIRQENEVYILGAYPSIEL